MQKDLWTKRPLGRTNMMVSRLGLGASFGVGDGDIERAFERGVNYFYWGSRRRSGFARGLRAVARSHREDMVVVVQSYSRAGLALRPSVDVALRRLQMDYADVLLLGWWNAPPPDRIVDAALALKEAGKVRAIMVSCHHRPSFASYIDDPCYDAIMVRYNAAHAGAEREVFPVLAAHPNPPGVVAYTATRWGALLDRRMVPADEPLPRASDCYRFALTNPHVDTVISGPRDGAELDEAMAALDRGPLDDDELAWMRRVGKGVHTAAAATQLSRPAHLWDRVTATFTGQRP